MTPLAQQIVPYHAGSAVLGVAGRFVGLTELQETGLSQAIRPDARVALHLSDPLQVIRALAALDGQVAAILLLSYTLAPHTALLLAQTARCTAFVSDDMPTAHSDMTAIPFSDLLGPSRRIDPLATEWLMTTSGTTGVPKIVPHSLRSLSRSVYRFTASSPLTTAPVWGLLYDPTRFAGLQVVLQALIGGGQLVAIDTSLPLAEQVAALADHGCTHLSATPTLWRRLMMVPGHSRLPLRQVTMGGEIADQPTLNAVRAAFPAARLSHIYASTEAGVGFSVTDGLAGFPLTYLDQAPGTVRLKIQDGILWLRPAITEIIPGLPDIEIDPEGYIRSGDQVLIAGARVLFLGRENGLINIGGVKVYPETVEAIVKTVPGVALVRVFAKSSPVTGSLVVAEVQLRDGADPGAIRRLIQDTCRTHLDREAVPAIIRFVADFATNAAGKLVRTGG